MRTPLVATLFAMSCSLPLVAQGVRARVPVVPDQLLALARQNLKFRTVLPGIPQTVSARDLSKSALFEIRGPTGAAVRLELVLPSALVAKPGEELPISFGAADGFASHLENTTTGQGFNPHQPLITTLGASGRLFVRLGGTVTPGLPQPGGPYSAEIMLIIYDIGS